MSRRKSKSPLTGANRIACGNLLLSIGQLIASRPWAADYDYLMQLHSTLVRALGLAMRPQARRSMHRCFSNDELDCALTQLEAAMKIVVACNVNSVWVTRAEWKLNWMLCAIRRRQTPRDQREHNETKEEVYQEHQYPVLVARRSRPRLVEYEYRISEKLIDLFEADTGQPDCTADQLISWVNSKTPEFFTTAALRYVKREGK